MSSNNGRPAEVCERTVQHNVILDSDGVIMFDVGIQLLAVQFVASAVVIVLFAVVVDISDAAVMCAGRLLVWRRDAEVVIRVACAGTTRVDERGVMCTFDEVTSGVDTRKYTAESLVQRIVAVRQCDAWIYSIDKQTVAVSVTGVSDYYRATHLLKSAALLSYVLPSVCPSVCLCVTLVIRGHTVSNCPNY